MIALLIAASAATVSPQLMEQGERVFNYSACRAYTRSFDDWAMKHDIDNLKNNFQRGFLQASWDEGYKWGLQNRKRLTLKVCKELVNGK